MMDKNVFVLCHEFDWGQTDRQTDSQDSGEKRSLTFHDLGILKPWKLMSSDGTLNDPDTGGTSCIDSTTTLHESFIFCISPQFKFSLGVLLAAISLFSEHHQKAVVLVILKHSKHIRHELIWISNLCKPPPLYED